MAGIGVEIKRVFDGPNQREPRILVAYFAVSATGERYYYSGANAMSDLFRDLGYDALATLIAAEFVKMEQFLRAAFDTKSALRIEAILSVDVWGFNIRVQGLDPNHDLDFKSSEDLVKQVEATVDEGLSTVPRR